MRKLLLSLVFLWGLIISSGAVASTNVSGPQSGTWDLAGSPYILTGDVTVEQGSSLTINSGVEIRTNSSSYETYISGHLQAYDANFTGNYTELITNEQGTLNLNSCRITTGSITYSAGSSGSVTNGDLGTTHVSISGNDVQLTGCRLGKVTVSQATPTINNNTFVGTHPLYCRAEYFPLMLDNTFSAGSDSTIHIQGGTVNQNMTWGIMDSVNQYEINSPVTVSEGSTLTVGSGTQLKLNYYSLTVYGSVVFSPSSKLYIYRTGLSIYGSAASIMPRN